MYTASDTFTPLFLFTISTKKCSSSLHGTERRQNFCLDNLSISKILRELNEMITNIYASCLHSMMQEAKLAEACVIAIGAVLQSADLALHLITCGILSAAVFSQTHPCRLCSITRKESSRTLSFSTHIARRIFDNIVYGAPNLFRVTNISRVLQASRGIDNPNDGELISG